jgi:glycosyltransferase involved in cell wall biosynthesis
VVMTLHNYRLACVNSLLFRDGRPCVDCVGTHPWHGVRHACYRGSRPQSAVAAVTIQLHRQRHTWRRDVDRYLAPTPFVREVLAAAGLPVERILVRPHTTADPGPRSAPPSRSRDVVAVVRLSREKGYDVLLEAMRFVDGRDLRLVVVGDGPDRDRLERSADARVTFAGPLPIAEVQARLLSARALVFPSVVFETFGLTLIEAMAAGTPVVASDLGGSRWIIEDAGRLVPAGDAGAWAAALSDLASDELVDGWGDRARRLWHQRYQPDEGLRGLEVAYAQATQSWRERCAL